MRCPEVVFGILNDPTRVDRVYASVFRGLIDTRRILLKSEERSKLFYEDMKRYARGTPDFTAGPVHGFMTACAKIGIKVMCTDQNVQIKTPLGAVLSLDTPHETHFKACIREACRYALIQNLIERTAPGKRDHRQDTEGITPHIDISATMKLLNCNAKEPEADEAKDIIWRPFKLTTNRKDFCRPL